MLTWLRKALAQQDPPPDSKPTDSYFEKLLRYIPADILAAWIAIDGILRQGDISPLWLNWGVFVTLLVLTPLYVCFVKTVPPGFLPSKVYHWITSCIAFSVWVFAIGGPFATLDWYNPVYGSVLLIITTLILPVIEALAFKKPPTEPPASDSKQD